MQVNDLKELKQAVKQGAPEILVSDVELAGKVRAWEIIRRTCNIAVFVILALALFAWADPLRWSFLATPEARVLRQVMLVLGVLLLFADYVLPAVRHYKIAGQDATGLKLVPRKSR